MQIDKAFLKANEKKIQKHIDALAKDLGMGIGERCSTSYGPHGFDIKIKFTISTDPYEEYKRTYINRIEEWACLPYTNWKVAWLGKTINAGGKAYTFVGMSNNRSKFCMVAILKGSKKETGFTIEGFEKNFGVPVDKRY